MSAEARADPAADREFVGRARAGDQAAARAIYRAHAPRVARRLRRILGEPTEVEDAVQVTFEAVFRSLHRFEDGRALAPWVDGFAVRIAQNVLRGRRRKRWLVLGEDRAERPEVVVAGDADERLARLEMVREVERAMDRLTPKQRVAFALHEIEGLSLSEIGRLAGTSPQAIRERLCGARGVVMRELSRRGVLPLHTETVMNDAGEGQP